MKAASRVDSHEPPAQSTQSPLLPTDYPQPEKLSHSKRFWTWISTGGGTAVLPFVDWRIQLLWLSSALPSTPSRPCLQSARSWGPRDAVPPLGRCSRRRCLHARSHLVAHRSLRGRAASERHAILTRSVEVLRERNATDDQISGMYDAALLWRSLGRVRRRLVPVNAMAGAS